MECPNCLHFNSPKATVCELCHRELASPTERPGQRPRAPGAPAEGLRQAGLCTQCGRLNPTQADKCKDCGTALARPRLLLKPKTAGTGFAVRARTTRTFLICPPLPPLQLEENQRYVIGRSDRADIMLPGELVSRNHAAISCKEGTWCIEDLGSSNGTFWNGTRLAGKAELEDSDEIVIGGFHMGIQVRKLGAAPAEGSSLPDVSNASTVSVTAAEVFREPVAASDPAVLEGSLDEVPLVEVLQLLNMGKRSGQLSLTAGETSKGTISIDVGEVVAAYSEGGSAPLSGKEALFELGLLDGGEFHFRKTRETSNELREIKEPTHVLLQKMLRLRRERDEGNA